MSGRDVKRDAIVQLVLGVIEGIASLVGRARRKRESVPARVDVTPIDPPRGNVTIIDRDGTRREL